MIKKFEFTERHTFLDYVFGGCRINLSLAIDYTQSNGKIHQSNSLHYYKKGETVMNQYMKAMDSIIDILNYYDYDKKINAYGFGAELNSAVPETSDCFALNGNIFNPACNSKEEIWGCYLNCLKHVKLSGPTNCAKIIQNVIDRSKYLKQTPKNMNYEILLILTDGDITDMEETMDAIVEASDLPISIIIAGIGGDGFEKLIKLDADKVPIYS